MDETQPSQSHSYVTPRNIYYGNIIEWLREQNAEYVIDRDIACRNDFLTRYGDVVMNIRGCNKVRVVGDPWVCDVDVFDEEKFPLPIALIPATAIFLLEKHDTPVIADHLIILSPAVRENFFKLTVANDIYANSDGGLFQWKDIAPYITE